VVSNGSVLVTGGAGYIGSHVVRQLGEAAEKVIVLDNLGRGFRQAVTTGELMVGDVGDYAAGIAVIGGASGRYGHALCCPHHRARVGGSAAQILRQQHLFHACSAAGLLENNVKNFVFSSTAAVYGMPDQGYADEESPTRPINPYGTSKLMSEWMLRDVAAISRLRYVALRYFQCGRIRSWGKDWSSDTGRHSVDQGGLRGDGGVNVRMYRYLAAITPLRMGRACGTYLHVEDLAAAAFECS